MKRIRPTLIHISKIGMPNPYQHIHQLHQQQLQHPELINKKKSFNVQLPPLNMNSQPKTARIRRNQLALTLNSQNQIQIPQKDQDNNENSPVNENADTNINKEIQNQMPVTCEYALNNLTDYLLDFEKKEIESYPDVYYIRKEKPQTQCFRPKNPNFYPFVQNDHIAYRYQQLGIMGKGAFGSVIKCFDHKNGRRVAVKIIKDQKKYHDQTRLERDILKIMQGCNRVVRFLKSFTFRGFFCIVTEILYKDCYTILKRQRYYGFNLCTLQMIAKQLAEAIFFAHKSNIIHCDIKPENVMFTNKRKTDIKLVDYGCSCYENQINFTYIQSRYFRAPEVVFGSQFGKEIDVWSYACVLVELFTGKPLFPAGNERELLEMFVSYFGNPPLELINGVKRAEKYFDAEGNLKAICENNYTIHQSQKAEPITPSSFKIEDLFNIKADDNESNVNDVAKMLCDLVKKCFCWMPKERITMEEILCHPFILSTDIKSEEIRLPILSAR